MSPSKHSCLPLSSLPQLLSISPSPLLSPTTACFPLLAHRFHPCPSWHCRIMFPLAPLLALLAPLIPPPTSPSVLCLVQSPHHYCTASILLFLSVFPGFVLLSHIVFLIIAAFILLLHFWSLSCVVIPARQPAISAPISCSNERYICRLALGSRAVSGEGRLHR